MPVRMNEGMDDGPVKKKKPEPTDGPLLSERDKAKIERRKKKDDRQREVLFDSIFFLLILFVCYVPLMIDLLVSCLYRFNINSMLLKWKLLKQGCLLLVLIMTLVVALLSEISIWITSMSLLVAVISLSTDLSPSLLDATMVGFFFISFNVLF